MVNNTIQNNKHRKQIFISFVASIAALCIFTLSLNISPTFAESLSEIPVIKTIAQVLTIRNYDFESENITGSVTIPEVDIDTPSKDGADEPSLEAYINDTIQDKVTETLTEATIRANEYKTAYLETGGTEEGYANKKMTVTVDYEVFIQNDDYISFRVFTHESLAAVYAENLYFTIDLKHQQSLTLEDLLGSDYINIIAEVVKADISKSPDKYFDTVKSEDWLPRTDTDFYINELFELIVVFDKYELAPGAAGRLEFKFNIK